MENDELIKIRRNFVSALCGASLCLVASPAISQERIDINQTVSLASYVSRGDYGEGVNTDILYFPLSYSYQRGRWGAQLTVPGIEVEGIGNVLVNIGGVSRAVAGGQRERNRGLGDSTFSISYQMDPILNGALFVDLRLDIKFPTADRDRGLGTGETDYSAQLDVSRSLGEFVLFGTIGYTFRGVTDFYAGLQDSAYVQLGVAKPLTSKWNVGVFYDHREPASSFSPEVHEVVPYVSYQISERWSFTGLTAFGFTEASADTAILGQISYSW